jgi:hypothetical protein
MADGGLDIDVIRVSRPPGNVLVWPDQQELVGPGVGGRRAEDAERDTAVAGPLPERPDGVVGSGAHEGEAAAEMIVER